MSSINYLLPGYTQQGFSWFRSELYDKGDKFAEKYQLGSSFVIGSVIILSKISEFVETPFKLIEDIALTMINLVGAIFEEKCRGHLKECAWQLFADTGYVFFLATIVGHIVLATLAPITTVSPVLLTCLAITIIYGEVFGILGSAGACVIEGFNVKNMADYHRIYWSRTAMMRQYGYKAVAKQEKKGLYFPGLTMHKSKITITFERCFAYFYNRLSNPKQAIHVYNLIKKRKDNFIESSSSSSSSSSTESAEN